MISLTLTACTGNATVPSATPVPTATVQSEPVFVPTEIVVATAAPTAIKSEPTATSAPTATLAPTNTPSPTNTLAPTATPEPTASPVPTDTPVPTSTPVPTDTPVPTSTPTPTDPPTPTPLPASEVVKEYTCLDDVDTPEMFEATPMGEYSVALPKFLDTTTFEVKDSYFKIIYSSGNIQNIKIEITYNYNTQVDKLYANHTLNRPDEISFETRSDGKYTMTQAINTVITDGESLIPSVMTVTYKYEDEGSSFNVPSVRFFIYRKQR